MRPNANAAVSHRSGREAIRRRKAGGELPLNHEARFLPAYAGGKLPHASGYIRRLPPTSPRPCTASRGARGWRAGNSPAARTKSPVHSACAPRWQITLRVRLRPSASCSGILRRTPHGFPQSMRPPGKGGRLAAIHTRNRRAGFYLYFWRHTGILRRSIIFAGSRALNYFRRVLPRKPAPTVYNLSIVF